MNNKLYDLKRQLKGSVPSGEHEFVKKWIMICSALLALTFVLYAEKPAATACAMLLIGLCIYAHFRIKRVQKFEQACKLPCRFLFWMYENQRRLALPVSLHGWLQEIDVRPDFGDVPKVPIVKVAISYQAAAGVDYTDRRMSEKVRAVLQQQALNYVNDPRRNLLRYQFNNCCCLLMIESVEFTYEAVIIAIVCVNSLKAFEHLKCKNTPHQVDNDDELL